MNGIVLVLLPIPGRFSAKTRVSKFYEKWGGGCGQALSTPTDRVGIRGPVSNLVSVYIQDWLEGSQGSSGSRPETAASTEKSTASTGGMRIHSTDTPGAQYPRVGDTQHTQLIVTVRVDLIFY